MKLKFKNITVISVSLLSFLLYVSIYPFTFIDLHQDGRIDLKDAIFAIKSLNNICEAEEIDSPLLFKNAFKNALEIFNILSGAKLKMEAKKKDTQLEPVYLVLDTSPLGFSYLEHSDISTNILPPVSNFLSPPTPPPEIV